jgi:hypothetical protein
MTAAASSPDWKPQMTYRGPADRTWPEGWAAVCGEGPLTMAKPTYAVRDPLVELESLCAWLEQATGRLEDAELRMTCGDAEFEDGWFGWNSFKIPGHFLTRLRALGVRLVIVFEPAAPVVETIES